LFQLLLKGCTIEAPEVVGSLQRKASFSCC